MIRVEERFWAKVDVGNSPAGCWLWRAGTNGSGYGRFWVGPSPGKWLYPHRLAYESMVGPIPEGLVIDHLCREPGCVNPLHMEAVSMETNTQRGLLDRGAFQRAVTHCPHGHEYTEENTAHRNDRRHCRACARERMRLRTGYYERRRDG